MVIFDVVTYKRTLAIITDLPTPETCKVFYQADGGEYVVQGAAITDVEPMQTPEHFTKGGLYEAVRLFQVFCQKLNLPTE